MAGAAPAPSMFAVFRNRSFTLLWSAQTVSTVGDALTSLAAGILVYRLTDSVLGVGLVLMATALPALLFGLVAGVFVDRYDRKRIMWVSHLVRAGLVGAIPLLVPHGIVWLFAAIVSAAAVGQFFAPAYESVLPELADDDELAAANAFVAIGSFGSAAVGFAVAGVLATGFRLEIAFYLDAVSFVVAALLILGARVRKTVAHRDTSVAAVIANLREGARFTLANDVLRSLLVLAVGTSVAVGAWNVLSLPFVERALGASAFVYGVHEALAAVGFVAGAFAMAALAPRLREGQWIVISLVGSGVLGVVYAFVTAVPPALALIALTGFFDAPDEIARRLLVQRNTTRDLRGRVNSVLFVARDLSLVVGMALAGLADIVDVRLVFAAAAVLVVVLGSVTAVLPGLGLPAGEWRGALALLRGAPGAPGPTAARAATFADVLSLARRNPALARLAPAQLRDLAAGTRVVHAPAGSSILHRGDVGDTAYFVIAGRAVAGLNDGRRRHRLETMSAGDFFGEFAALTGTARTADVMIEEDAMLLEVPAVTLRTLTAEPGLHRMFVGRMDERRIRMNLADLPRFGGIDAGTLRDLRTPTPSVAAADDAVAPAGADRAT